MLIPVDIAKWANLLKQTRAFFDERGFTEVMTDHVVPAGAFESTIDSLKVSYTGGKAELHTSPEIEMKVLLARERRSIYQICRCFRDDPPTGVHLREFTMIEFYRVPGGWREVLADTKALFERLAGRSLPFQERTVAQLFLEHTGVDLAKCREGSSLRNALLAKKAIHLSRDDDWGDLFFKAWIERVEPRLPHDAPFVVTGFPARLSALSKPGAAGEEAERFEIYWRGMELCNGCTELDDPAELRRRFVTQTEERERTGKSAHPVPQRLLTAMEKGLPACAGVAVGLDRLYACLHTPGKT